jgi:signal transduction histidine kinase
MNIASNLFLLMQTISKMHQKERIIPLFIESLNELFPTAAFEYLQQDIQPNGSVIPIFTNRNTYGFLKNKGSAVIDETHKILVTNSALMLAVILERLELIESISKERDTFEQLANTRLTDLRERVKELSFANSASINLIEDLNSEIKKRIQSEQELIIAKEQAEEREQQIQKLYSELQTVEEETAAANEELMNASDSLMENNIELEKAKKRAEESDRLKSAFLANMSHEIRTPMNGILGFADLLKEPELTGEQQQKYIGIIQKSGIRMLNIINDIIDISKIEAGQMKVEMNASNINDQIEYIYTFFKPEVEARGIKFSFKNSLPAKETMIFTDREKVYAILTNLVKNAIKFTEKGSIEFGYEIVETNKALAQEQAKQALSLQFFVKDTGIGIPNDRQQAIFERFIQADINDTMARQGAGLGLAITKSYIEMLGGNIWVESEVDKGSAFYFTLPFKTEPIENYLVSALDSTYESEVQDNSNVSELKILIAEDDETSEILITEIIEVFGKEIIRVRTGLEAIEACRKNPDIDLILMDIQMPEMGGFEATQKIRDFNKEVVIIAQTAYALAGDREKAIEAGCDDYISKPLNKNLLKVMINKKFS